VPAGGGQGGGGCTPTSGGIEACEGLDNDCNGRVDENSPCAAGCFAATYGGHGYMFCGTKLVWDLARAQCEQSSMHLVRIDDALENAWLAATAYADATSAASFGLFVGGSDQAVEGTWRWLDGAQFWAGGGNGSPVGGLFTNWRSNEPNNQGTGEDCLALRSDGTWSDLRCGGSGAEMAFACETP
jgi:hypothetical protein